MVALTVELDFDFACRWVVWHPIAWRRGICMYKVYIWGKLFQTNYLSPCRLKVGDKDDRWSPAASVSTSNI